MHTIFAVDLLVDIKVDAKDDQVGQHIGSSRAIQNVWIVEINLFSRLDEAEDDDEVGSIESSAIELVA